MHLHLRSLLRRHPPSTTLPTPPLIHFFSHHPPSNEQDDNQPNNLSTIKNTSTNTTPQTQTSPTDKEAIRIQTILKLHVSKPSNKVLTILSKCGISLTEDLVLNLLKRHICDWKSTETFFRFVGNGKNSNGYSPSLEFYQELLEIFGRNKRFDLVQEVLDEMLERGFSVSNETWEVVLRRYAGGHCVDEAISWFWKRGEMGLEVDVASFQSLLKWLCRYKHASEAEELFYKGRKRFGEDIKSWNIIFAGWCLKGELKEPKRVWKDIVASKCKRDIYSYGIYINMLVKKGKVSEALELCGQMWAAGCNPDMAICNTVIHGLCHKKRVPQAIELIKLMRKKGYELNIVSYNSLIQHLSKIRRMDKVEWVLDEMKQQGVEPNVKTYSFLMRHARRPEEVYEILEEMERKGCELVIDTYILLLRLFMKFGSFDRLKSTWDEMEKSGVGHDIRCYAVMVRGFYIKEMIEDALLYYHEMTSKGIVPDPKTEELFHDMNEKMKQKRKQMRPRDERYTTRPRDEVYTRNPRVEGYTRNPRDEGYTRNPGDRDMLELVDEYLGATYPRNPYERRR